MHTHTRMHEPSGSVHGLHHPPANDYWWLQSTHLHMQHSPVAHSPSTSCWAHVPADVQNNRTAVFKLWLTSALQNSDFQPGGCVPQGVLKAHSRGTWESVDFAWFNLQCENLHKEQCWAFVFYNFSEAHLQLVLSWISKKSIQLQSEVLYLAGLCLVALLPKEEQESIQEINTINGKYWNKIYFIQYVMYFIILSQEHWLAFYEDMQY